LNLLFVAVRFCIITLSLSFSRPKKKEHEILWSLETHATKLKVNEVMSSLKYLKWLIRHWKDAKEEVFSCV